jgi:hypothetical protein
MLDAFLMGAAAQSALLPSGLAVYVVSKGFVGALAGFGAGALISAIAFGLIPQGEGLEHRQLALWLLVGGVVSSRTSSSSAGSARVAARAPSGSWSGRSSTASPSR